MLDVQSTEVTVQATVRQIASTSGTGNLLSLTTPSINNDDDGSEDNDENETDRDDAISREDIESDSGVNTTRLSVSSFGRHRRSPSTNQIVPYIREPVADSDPEIEDISRALVPVIEIRFLQKRTLRFAREILGRHPQGGTSTRDRSQEDSRRSPSLSQESSGAAQRHSLHPEQHAQQRQSVDEYLDQSPNSGSEPGKYRQDEPVRLEESIRPRRSSDEETPHSPYSSRAHYGRQSSSTVPLNLGIPEPSHEYLQSSTGITQGSSSPSGSVNDIRSSTLGSSAQSFLLKDLNLISRTHEIHFDNPALRDVS